MLERMTESGFDGDSVRLDKWLWAARFFRTRSLARAAIEAGHVRCDGERPKVSKAVRPGMRLRIRRGHDETEVEVLALSGQRRGASEAQRLYAETAESRARHEALAAERRLRRESAPPPGRPDKKQRRALRQLKR